MPTYQILPGPKGRYLEISGKNRPPVSAIFNASGDIEAKIKASVSILMSVRPEDIGLVASSGGFGAAGGETSLLIKGATLPEDPEPLVEAVSKAFESHFPEGCVCKIHFIPAGP